MYNRYLRNDHGVYTPVPMNNASIPPPISPPRQNTQKPPPNTSYDSAAKDEGFFDRILEKLHLGDLDSSDLMLLLLLFFLFQEKADDELLIALGLLLIL